MIPETIRKPELGLSRMQSLGEQLAAGPWKKFVESIDNSILRNHTAIVLDNALEYINSLEETTKTLSIGDFQKYAFPLIRAIFPELAAQSLFSVQPMMGPTSLVFFLDFVYGTTKGSVTRGSKVFDSIGLGTSNPYYSSSTIDLEVIGTSTGASKQFTGNLAFTTVRSGTIQITDGTNTIEDDGNGKLVGDVDAGGTNTINYQTGAFDVTVKTQTAAATKVACRYDYDLEAQSNIPEIDLVLSSQPVIAQPRKLKTKWSLESAFNLRALHGLEAETELTAAVGAEIRFEIDRELISDCKNIVPSFNLAPGWSKSKLFKDTDAYTGVTGAATTVGYTEQLLSLVNQFVVASNKVFKSTGRAIPTWIVISLTVADVVETLPGYVANPGLPNGLIKGIYNAGTLNGRWTIFKDPFFTDDEWLMGYKGTSFLEAGLIYAPYIPLYTTPLIVLDDFIGRKGLATQYGKKVVNPRFYAKGKIYA